MNNNLKEIPEYIVNFLKQKKVDLDSIQLLYNNREEFDFDHWQHYYVFLLDPSLKHHAKLIIVRYTYSYYDGVDDGIIEMESRKLIKVL